MSHHTSRFGLALGLTLIAGTVVLVGCDGTPAPTTRTTTSSETTTITPPPPPPPLTTTITTNTTRQTQ
jgi:hypothetical protein